MTTEATTAPTLPGSALDLRALISPVIEAANSLAPGPGKPVRLGVSDATKAPVIAALAAAATAPVLVLATRGSRALDLVEELRTYIGIAESDRVHLYPQRDGIPYEAVREDPWDTRERLATIAAFQKGEAVIVVAPVEAAAQPVLSPAAARAGLWSIKSGQALTPDDLLRRLNDAGYLIEPLVEAPGQAARRGGIVDLFPPQAAEPVRIEFFGSQVDSIRGFDPETQRSRARLDSIDLGVAGEFTPDPALARELLATLDFGAAKEEEGADIQQDLEAIAAGQPASEHSFLPALLSRYHLIDHLPDGCLVILDEPADLARALDEYVAETATTRLEHEARGELPIGLPPAQANWADLERALAPRPQVQLLRFGGDGDDGDSSSARLPFGPAPGFAGKIRVLAREVSAARAAGKSVVIVSQQSGRLTGILREDGVSVDTDDPTIASAPAASTVQVLHGSLPHGWELRTDPVVLVLTDAEIFGFVKRRRALRAPGGDRSSLIADLSPGDYVVHIEHGIARFNGLIVRTIEGVSREFLELTYAEGDRLFVPVDQADRVARYVGPGEFSPQLTRLGSGEWVRTRDRVRRAIADIAQDLLELYASRQLLPGHAFSPDTPWQQELEASFPYVETPDQATAIRLVKQDMESPRPMDRLICGDVGYGKTEVAVRAAFKAVMDGFQVAILVPTTVLAQQHFNTFRERLASLPARVEMLSRFLSDKEAREVTRDAGEGTVDILIGTHRILQKDVAFKKLGLVIIDEEQRFGVAHKERLKQMRKELDVLTLSATPIPRTLHMSLIGIRDLSNMMTPPEDRLPIRTYVMESDDAVIREAVTREIERGGQVFVHNRVYNIELIAARIRRLVPEANVAIGHGQMHEDQLEKTMLAFAGGEVDVLVCTTIIESGLDVPNANTIIINQADHLGLAQLYQLRGRVGRGAVRAYAYLLYEKNHALSETAQRRLQAIFEATELGAGFQIAIHDLEIRGAGNLLGAEQSGHMAAVGFDLYVRLLADSVERLKAIQRGEPPPPPALAKPALSLDLPLSAHLPDNYVPDLNLRLALYQRLAKAESNEEADAIESEMNDRFGPLPQAAKNLLWVVRLRLLATEAGVGAITTEDANIVVRVLPGREIDRTVYPRRLAGLKSVSAHQLHLDREGLGQAWREGLVRAIAALAGATRVAA